MNIIEKLLKYDSGLLEAPTKVYTMKLNKLKGDTFEFPLVALSAEVMAEIKEDMMEIRRKDKAKETTIEYSLFESQVKTILAGCDIFKNSELQKHFGARSPKELITKLMLPGEIDKLADEIEALSGFEDDDEVDDIKN